jgi:hypothetical protein
MYLGLTEWYDRYKFSRLVGLGCLLLASLLPDGHYAGANSYGAPPYLAAVGQLGHYL